MLPAGFEGATEGGSVFCRFLESKTAEDEFLEIRLQELRNDLTRFVQSFFPNHDWDGEL